MPKLIESPAIIEAAGTKPKMIEEFIGRANTGHKQLSVARMKSPTGWIEPGQKPQFREVTQVGLVQDRLHSRQSRLLFA